MKIKHTIIELILLVLVFHSDFNACTVVIAGKNTTTDGSIIFAKSEDDGGNQLDYYWHIPRKAHNPDSFLLETSGLQIPQVEKTYAYFWDQTPKQMYSNVLINEWGVAFGSNACRSKEDPVEELEARGEIVSGGIGFRLRFILAQRCKTAREAVELAGELINKYGYSGSGRCLNIVDPNEAWQLQMVRGKHYVARKVQDDEVVFIANTYSIREIDLNDTSNFLCSPDIIDYAMKRGWYNPEKDGKLDFARAYAPDDVHKADRNTHRAWMLARLLDSNFPLTAKQAENGEMPVSVKPDKKLAVQDLFQILRNHFENTDLDEYNDKGVSPHYLDNYPVCNGTTHKAIVIQQRNWLPVEIGMVYWRALSHPCESVFIPWYLGIDSIPGCYQKAYETLNTTEKNLLTYHFNGPVWQQIDLDLESATCVFTLLAEIGDSKYKKHSPIIRAKFDELEADLISKQKRIEEEALLLYQKDKDKSFNCLTDYCSEQSMLAFEKAKKMITELLNANSPAGQCK